MKKKFSKFTLKEKNFLRKTILIFLVIQTVFVLWGIVVFKDTQQLTVDDCVIIVGKPENIQVKTAVLHRTELTINSKFCAFHGQYCEFPTMNEAAEQLATENTVTAMLKKERHFPYFNNSEETLIVDLRSESTVYCDLNLYNQIRATNRISGFVAIAIFEIITVGIFCIVITFVYLTSESYKPKNMRKSKTGDGSRTMKGKIS